MPKKKTVLIGFAVTILLAIISLIFVTLFFGNSQLDAINLFHVGVDALGTFICAVLYYGCIGQDDTDTRSFRVLIILASSSFIINKLMWLTVGLEKWHIVYFWLCIASKIYNLMMIFYFYVYVRRTLSFEGKLAKFADKLIPALLLFKYNE